MGVDPIPTSAESMTVYQYGGNNPVMMNDPMGDLLKADTPNPNADYGPGPDSFARDRAYVYGSGGVEGGFSQYGRATLHNAIGDLSQWESAYQRMAMSHATSSVGNTITVNYSSDVGSGHIDVSSNDIMQFINSSLGMYYLPTIYVSNGRLNTPSWWGDSQRFIDHQMYGSQGGAGNISTGISTGLFLTSTTFSLLNENASRNINAIQETNSLWTKMTGKLPGSAARNLEAETFTKAATDAIGKRIFFVGLGYSVYSISQDHSASNIGWNIADNLVGAAGIWIPGAQIPALVYFGVRFSYDMYQAYKTPQ